MIIKKVRGNILECPEKHVVFPINTSGQNNGGIAGIIGRKTGWDGVLDGDECELGSVLTRVHGGKTWHGIVCHSLEDDGYAGAATIVRKALDGLKVPKDEPIAIVMIGAGPVGLSLGADVGAILAGMENCNKSLVLYSL